MQGRDLPTPDRSGASKPANPPAKIPASDCPSNNAESLLKEAITYAERGWKIVPLHSPGGRAGRPCDCNKPGCRTPGKHPRVQNWTRQASDDVDQVRKWWNTWPRSNPGICTGQASGIVVLDFDEKNGGLETLNRLRNQYGDALSTLQVRTGGGGVHLYFRAPDDGTLKNRTGVLPGMDVRGDGGQIVAPPSLHASGSRYEWVDSGAPILDLPDDLVALLRKKRSRTKAAGPSESIPEGQRNDSLFREACSMRATGAGEDVLLRKLRDSNASRCRPPLEAEEVDQIAASATRYDPGPTPAGDFALSDLGNAERLRARHGADARFCPAIGWFIWDGRRWKRDETEGILRLAIKTVRNIYAEAATEIDNNRRKAIAKHAHASERKERLLAMVRLAQPLLAITPADLDRDKYLLTVRNGTLDLRTGTLLPHRREDFITRLAPVEHDPEATSARFEAFLKTATGDDAELQRFLQRAAGYFLLGGNPEERLFFIHGPTASGKSTFLETLRATLGDYARTADFEAFLKRSHVGGARNDIARLAGARLVVSIEVEEGTRMAEGLVKMVTGGDTVTARYLYKEAFEFVPDFTLVLCANKPPEIKDDDDALWRRLLALPFSCSIPEGRRDPTVKAELKDPGRAGPAVLAWLLTGCREYQRVGLAVPDSVTESTGELRQQMDPLAPFLEECCEVDPGFWCFAGALHREYEEWAKENGRRPISPIEWGRRLKDKGLTPGRYGKGRTRTWEGLRLRADSADGGLGDM